MSQYGSFFNLLMSKALVKEPEVGDGATLLLWTDRHAYTIVEVIRYKSGPNKGEVKAVAATRDKVTRVDGFGMSDMQDWSYETNPVAERVIFTKRKSGDFIKEGSSSSRLLIGIRQEYYDFSF